MDLRCDYETGTYDENGTYTGIVGMHQRGELDMSFFVINPASTPFEPVIIGPPLVSSDMMMISSVKKLKPIEVHVVDWFSGFDAITHYYLLIICLMFSIFFIILPHFQGLILNSRLMIHSFTELLWKIYMLAVDQECFSPVTSAQKVLTVSFALFSFLMIQGIFTNLLSTDKVAENPPDTIDYLSDVLPGGRFENVTPVVLDGLWHTPPLRMADPNTEEGKLWKQIMRTESYSLIRSSGTRGSGNLQEKIEHLEMVSIKLDRGESYFIFTSDFTDYFTFKSVLCRVPGMFSSDKFVHFSRQHFSPGTLNVALSKMTDANVRLILEYSFRTILEFGLLKHSAKSSAFSQLPGTKSVMTGLECASNIQEPQDPNEIFLSLNSLGSVLLYFGWFAVACNILLLGEILTAEFHLKLEAIKKRKSQRLFDHVNVAILAARRAEMLNTNGSEESIKK